MKKLFNNYKQRQLQACEIQKGKVLIKKRNNKHKKNLEKK